VTTVEINPNHLNQARRNINRAGVLNKITFIEGDSLSKEVLDRITDVTAAFLDPDWAVSGANHVYKFRQSNTQPPADKLLQKILTRTKNIALILPPYVDTTEFQALPTY
jgi:16S rRNA G966 N2-methylase RsmD